MACKPCAQRRAMIVEAQRKGGLKGVVKVLPAVGRHLVAHPTKRAK
ncbi:hypothetical protein [Aureimonas flava]|nr:hypothetical protein [Aureimonas flava]